MNGVARQARTRCSKWRPISSPASAMRSVTKRLASPSFGGRDNDTPESAKTQRELIKRLRRLGEGPVVGAPDDEAYRQPFVQSGQIGTNLFAVIRGSELPDEYVMVGGHYDHLGSRSNAAGDCSRNRVPGLDLCPGATDNAAGTAIAIESVLVHVTEPPTATLTGFGSKAKSAMTTGTPSAAGVPVVASPPPPPSSELTAMATGIGQELVRDWRTLQTRIERGRASGEIPAPPTPPAQPSTTAPQPQATGPQ